MERILSRISDAIDSAVKEHAIETHCPMYPGGGFHVYQSTEWRNDKNKTRGVHFTCSYCGKVMPKSAD